MCFSMTNFFTNRTHRTKAHSVPLVWMLELISGVVNPCIAKPPGAVKPAETATHSVQDDAKHTNMAGHSQTEATSAQTDVAHVSKQPCLQVCDDSSKFLLKKYLTAQIDPGSPIVVAALWSLITPIRLQYKQQNSSKHAASLLLLKVVYSKFAFKRAGKNLRA